MLSLSKLNRIAKKVQPEGVSKRNSFFLYLQSELSLGTVCRPAILKSCNQLLKEVDLDGQIDRITLTGRSV